MLVAILEDSLRLLSSSSDDPRQQRVALKNALSLCKQLIHGQG